MDETGRNPAQRSNVEWGLSGPQSVAAQAVAWGATDAEAAERCGVSRQTVWRWRTQNPFVMAEINRRREAIWSGAADRVRALVSEALDAVEREISGGTDAYRAAFRLLELAGMGSRDFAPQGHTDAGDIISEAARAKRPGSRDRLMEDLEGGPATESEIIAALDDINPRALDPGPVSPDADGQDCLPS